MQRRQIDRGVQREPTHAVLRCHRCGEGGVLVIPPSVARAHPATEEDPDAPAHLAAIHQGWLVGLAQVGTRDGVMSVDLTLCPACVAGLALGQSDGGI